MRMQWEKAKINKRLFNQMPAVTEVDANADFWRLWHEDKEAMKADGYYVKKLEDGWHAYCRIWVPNS